MNHPTALETTMSAKYGPYTISGADGKPLDPGARFFVLRYDSDAPRGFFARQALRLYCALIKGTLPSLAAHLAADVAAESDEGEGE